MKRLIWMMAAAALLGACQENNTPTGRPEGPARPEATADGGVETTAADRIVAGIARTAFPDREVVFGQPEDFAAARTELQAAIDACSAAGGGRVRVTPGDYWLNGPIVLKSNVDLHVEEGAVLQFSGRADDFLPAVYTRWEGTELYGRSPMIYALHQTNIALTGHGVIDAQGSKEMAAWAQHEMPDVNRLRSMGEMQIPLHKRVFGQGTILRPQMVQFVGCSRVLVEDVTLKDSPFWTIHPVYCDNVIVRGVTIDSHNPNNDGCDPESSSNVLIEHCTFRCGDDAVAIKAGRDADARAIGRPSENIVIRDCVFSSDCNGLCIGSEMSGGVAHVYMDRVAIGTVKNALYFKSNRDRGGYIRDVHVHDITVHRALGAILRFETNYFGYRGGNFPSVYEDFDIARVQADSADCYAIYFDGIELPADDALAAGGSRRSIRRIAVDDFHVAHAAYARPAVADGQAANPIYFYLSDDIRFSASTVNGSAVPTRPAESPTRETCDVW